MRRPSSGQASREAQDDEALAYYRQAKINWRQAEGQSLTIGLNKHPFTESLLPLIPEFRQLTGINVEYLILPEAEYFTKLVADLSQQRGEFSVIMTGPMRNWQYVPPDWILPLDDFLNNPKLTDPELVQARRLLSGADRGQPLERQDRRRRRRGPALLDPRARGELHPRLPQGHLRPVQHQGADDARGDGRGGAAGEEERRHPRHRRPRHAEPSRAWAPASSAASSPTPTASGASSTASSTPTSTIRAR